MLRTADDGRQLFVELFLPVTVLRCRVHPQRSGSRERALSATRQLNFVPEPHSKTKFHLLTAHVSMGIYFIHLTYSQLWPMHAIVSFTVRPYIC